jgi:hypothetical protein
MIRDKQLQALALLEQAGWKPDGDKLVNAEASRWSSPSSMPRPAWSACCCRTSATWRRSASP